MNIDKNRMFKENVIDSSFTLGSSATEILLYINDLEQQLKQKDELLGEIEEKLKNRIDLLNHDYFKTTNRYERDCISFEIENLEDMLLNLYTKEKDGE